MTLNELLDLSDKAVALPEQAVYEAVVAEDATNLAPVRVVVPTFSSDLSFGPAPWSPVTRADGVYYPKRGDRAVVLRPEPSSLWIAVWTPEATEPDICGWFADFEADS